MREEEKELLKLTKEDLDRLRRFAEKKYSYIEKKVPDKSIEGIFSETLIDLFSGKRNCPLDKVNIKTCILQIIRSKVSHIYEKYKKEKISDINILENENGLTVEENSELRRKIINRLKDDELSLKIVKIQLNSEEGLKPYKEIAETLGVDIKEIYNANKRLRRKLAKLKLKY